MGITIHEFADIIDKNIIVIYYPNQDGRVSASFEDCGVSDGVFFAREHGNGKSASDAIKDYKQKIEGKRIAFNAENNNIRQEFVAPKFED